MAGAPRSVARHDLVRPAACSCCRPAAGAGRDGRGVRSPGSGRRGRGVLGALRGGCRRRPHVGRATSCRRATGRRRTARGSSWPSRTGSAPTSGRSTWCSPGPQGRPTSRCSSAEIEARDHPRVVRALRYRDDVRVWRTPHGDGHLLVGRGLAGRWEMAFEVEPAARGPGWAAGSPPRPPGSCRRASSPGPRSPPGTPRRCVRCSARRLPPRLRRGPAAARPAFDEVDDLSPCGGSGSRSAGPASP